MPDVHFRNALTVRWLTGGPRPLRFALGLAAVVAGVLVFVRPTASLDLLAVLVGFGAIIEGLLAGWETAASKRWRTIVMSLWIGTGVIILITPWLTVQVLGAVVALGLGAVGATRIYLAIRRPHRIDERVTMISFGIAAILFAAITMVWRDISMVVVAVAFASWMIISGIQSMWESTRRPRRTTHLRLVRSEDGPSALRRTATVALSMITVTAAIVSVVATVVVTREDAITDPFYAAPRTLPDEPGRLIRAQPFETTSVPPGAVAWRILYSTTDNNGEITVASGLVVAPDNSSRHPVISWAHGTTGDAQACAPSLLERPFASGGMFILKQVVAEGWAFVASDYPGLGTAGNHPYLVGKPTGYSVLDATRAAIQLDGTRLSRRTVLWGHSQGGHGALWASQLAESYAPELVVEGVAGISAAGDLPGLVETMGDVTGGIVLSSYVMDAYVNAYPDVRAGDYVRPGSESAMSEYPKRCLEGPAAMVSVVSVAIRTADRGPFRVSPGTGRLGARLRENVPAPPQEMPVLLATGADDPLLSPTVQQNYATSLCDRGDNVDYRMLEGEDHVSMLYSISPFIPALKKWTNERFEGVTQKSTCAPR